MEGDTVFLPEAFESLYPFAGNRVALGMGDMFRPQAHLSQLVAEPARDDVETGSALSDLVQCGQHLGDERDVEGERVHRGDETYTGGGLGQGGDDGHGFESRIPVV